MCLPTWPVYPHRQVDHLAGSAPALLEAVRERLAALEATDRADAQQFLARLEGLEASLQAHANASAGSLGRLEGALLGRDG